MIMAGCPKEERVAYNLVAGGKAALVDFRGRHQECQPYDTITGLSPVKLSQCEAQNRLTSAKDTIIDAANVYCSGADFDKGGVCNPPAKGSPASQQALAKLKAAIANYEQVEKDVQGIITH